MGEEFWLWLSHTNALLVFYGSASAALVWVTRKMILGAKQARDMMDVLGRLEKEFRPNGGTSLKDAVTSLNKDVKEMKDEVALIRKAVKKNGAQYWASIATSRIPTFETDEHGLCTRVNPSMLRLSQRVAEEWQGNGWVVSIHPEDREKISNSWALAVRQHRNFEETYRIRAKDGTTYEVDCAATVLPSEAGVYGYIGSYTRVEKIG